MFEKTDSTGYTEVLEGVHLKTVVYGQLTLMVKVRFEKGAIIPMHSHPHEQTGTLITGKLEFVVDGETLIAEPGDTWSIAGELEHMATAIVESHVIEVFSPVRDDYLPYYNAEK